MSNWYPKNGLHRAVIVTHKYDQADYTGTVLCKLADYFNVTTDYLLGREEDEKRFDATE